ncbi:MMPL family transporter [Companilactobacillus halodurans]|uniref:MMPL family transporter n=1 Tax=Companilactobacillus halodurans TaxID=2584183 RepID=A0A5P0ZWA8_9LACO|nr:MMPL family transporter [Companilactobacillus halodurans]MQS76223.1 MMPL family transporter [Companilactobacillus halodurans]MQS97363.1 MMPL family transporter [Companilactobacillus halodurans]
MKSFKNPRHILTLIAWIIIVLVAIFALPNISQLVKENGQITVPDSYESEVASRVGDKYSGTKATQLTLVYHSDNALTNGQKHSINKKVHKLNNNKGNLHIDSITSVADSPESSAQLISKNKKTELVLVNVKGRSNLQTKAKKIENKAKVSGLKTYTTGEDLLSDVFSDTTEKGLQKTEIIAAIFIFIVLVLVFRSVIIPIISLLTVGVSFIVSLSVVMNAAQYFNFPISDFTQVFLVVVLFGIGTDYNILLYNKFKEELATNDDADAAAITTRKTAGKTLLYSGLSVLIGFTVLSLAKFSFYQSAVGVAIGIAVLIPVLLTLNIFFMSALGKKMFWPSKNWAENNNSKLWHGLSSAAIARPVILMGLILIIGAAFALTNSSQLNFNTADEVPNSDPAKQGYLQVQKDFSKGMAGPTTLYIKSDKSLANQTDLGTIDDLTSYIKKEPGVKKVMSVTQPMNKKIDALYLKDQLKTVNSGLAKSQKGLKQISTGLNSANQQLTAADVSGNLSQVQTLADGTQQLASGSAQLDSGIGQYLNGSTQVNSGLTQLQAGSGTLQSSVSQIASGSNQLNSQMSSVTSQISSLTSLMSQMEPLLAQSGSSVNTAQMAQLPSMISQFESGVSQLNSAINQLNASVPTLTSGIDQAAAGSNQLVATNSELSSASSQVASGASTVNTGVQTMNTQMQQLGTQVTQLQSGLSSAVDGINQVQQGSQTVSSYLTGLKNSYLGDKLYVPKAQIKDGTLDESFDNYLSKNKKIAQVTIVLKDDPASQSATKVMRRLRSDVKSKVKNTSLSDDQVVFGGQTSSTTDLEKLSQSDFKRTAVIMIIGIGIALIFVTRSIMQPFMIILTLLIAYITSLGITRWLSGLFIGKSLLTWNTPFFTFIMLVALGVDYSIFLMTRYRAESANLNMKARVACILSAATFIGTVVISAVIILSGTFAALIPSGVMTLIQVAIGVIVGLIIILLTLPIMMSAYIKLTYMPGGNKKQKKSKDNSSDVSDTDKKVTD